MIWSFQVAPSSGGASTAFAAAASAADGGNAGAQRTATVSVTPTSPSPPPAESSSLLASLFSCFGCCGLGDYASSISIEPARPLTPYALSGVKFASADELYFQLARCTPCTAPAALSHPCRRPHDAFLPAHFSLPRFPVLCSSCQPLIDVCKLFLFFVFLFACLQGANGKSACFTLPSTR